MATGTAGVGTRLLDRLLGHNEWALRVLLERCRRLTPGQFGQRFEIGPGTLHDTLLHVVACMRRWVDRIEGRPLRPSLEEEGRRYTPDELIRLLDEVAPEFGEVARRVVGGDRVDTPMEVAVPGRPEPFVFTQGTAVVHVLTHGVHHRAQALNMLRRLGVKDLPELSTADWELAGG